VEYYAARKRSETLVPVTTLSDRATHRGHTGSEPWTANTQTEQGSGVTADGDGGSLLGGWKILEADVGFAQHCACDNVTKLCTLRPSKGSRTHDPTPQSLASPRWTHRRWLIRGAGRRGVARPALLPKRLGLGCAAAPWWPTRKSTVSLVMGTQVLAVGPLAQS
jgi:hypothetical protein